MKIYRRRSRRLELSLGIAFPEPTPKSIKKPKNIARIALDVKAYLKINPYASYGDAAEHYNMSRARISQLIKIVDNLPLHLLKRLSETNDPALLKKYSGKRLLQMISTSIS